MENTLMTQQILHATTKIQHCQITYLKKKANTNKPDDY